MKAKIEVANKDEANFLQAGMADPEMRAMVLVTGILAGLTADQRERVLKFVTGRRPEQNPAANGAE